MPVRHIASLALAGILVTTAGTALADDAEHCRFSSRSFDTGRIGIGGAVGHEWQIDQRDGDQVSVLGQLRLTPRLTGEVELGQTEYDDGLSIDKRFGGALAVQVGRLAFLSPYILAGGGVYGNETARAPYIEAGAGVKFPISRNFVLMLDVRSGHRYAADEAANDDVVFAGSRGTPDVIAPGGGEIDYSRWRLIGMVFF